MASDQPHGLEGPEDGREAVQGHVRAEGDGMERYRAQKAATTPPVLPLSVQMRVAAEMAAPEIRWLAEMIGTEWQAEALRLEGAVDASEVERLADAIDRDKREPDKVLCHLATLRRLVLDARPGGQ